MSVHVNTLRTVHESLLGLIVRPPVSSPVPMLVGPPPACRSRRVWATLPGSRVQKASNLAQTQDSRKQWRVASPTPHLQTFCKGTDSLAAEIKRITLARFTRTPDHRRCSACPTPTRRGSRKTSLLAMAFVKTSVRLVFPHTFSNFVLFSRNMS